MTSPVEQLVAKVEPVAWISRQALDALLSVHVGDIQIHDVANVMFGRFSAPLFAAPVPQATEGWRPIETAPRDGTEILIGGCKVFGPGARTAHWGAGKFDRKTKSYNQDWTNGAAWGFKPTHWMPLPAAPTPKAEGEQQ